MNGADGKWVGLGVGDVDPNVPRNSPDWHRVTLIREKLHDKYRWARDMGITPGDTYTELTAAAIEEFAVRVGLTPPRDPNGLAVADYAIRVRLGSYPPPAPPEPVRPVVFTVEGHLSDPMAGPCADTARILEAEGHCWWQPVGYDSVSIPFNNPSGVNELARLLGNPTTEAGHPFPLGTPFVLMGFSQGATVVTDFYEQFLQPGQIHEPRARDLISVVCYGNPSRATGSIAPWSVGQAGGRDSHGLDPYKRLGQPGMPPKPDYWMDVWRKGDLFADCEDGKSGEVKAAVYEAVARADFFSNPASLVAQIADLFSTPLEEVVAIFNAIVSGIGFLMDGQGAPHYAPYNLDGGLARLRGVLNQHAAISA